jgi:hypothetical protein
MAIARKPKVQENTTNTVDIEALIAKGGSVAQPLLTTEGDDDGVSKFTLRVPTKLLTTLDKHRRAQPLRKNRQIWILEAIIEKLEREGSQVKPLKVDSGDGE